MKIGRVLSSEIIENRDGDSKVMLLTVEISDPDDPQSVEYIQAAGVDYNPPPDTTVFIDDVGNAWKIAAGADDGIEPEAAPGEYEIYAFLAGVKKGRLKCNLDGTVQAGITALDFVAQAGKVLSELQAIKADFDALKTAYDSHTHLYAPGPSPTVPTATPLPVAPTPHTPAGVESANLKSED